MDASTERNDGSSESPTPPRKRPLPAHPTPHGAIVALVMLITLAGYATIAMLGSDGARHAGRPGGAVFVIGSFIAGTIVASVVMGIVYFVSRRSSSAARWTFCIVLVLGLMGQVNGYVIRSIAHADNETEYQNIRSTASSALELSDMGSQVKALDLQIAALERAAREGHGEMAVLSRVMAQLLRPTRKPAHEYNHAEAVWKQLAATDVKDREDVAARLLALEDLERTSRTLSELAASTEARMDAALKEAGIPSASRRAYTRPARASEPPTAEVWRRMFEFIALERDILQLLANKPDKWNSDPETGELHIQDPMLARDYADASTRQDAGLRALEEARTRLIELRHGLVDNPGR